MHNEPGALYRLLQPFNDHDVDMTRLETRPSPTGNWNYVFFIDFVGHLEDQKVIALLADVRKVAAEIQVLGSYPKAVL